MYEHEPYASQAHPADVGATSICRKAGLRHTGNKHKEEFESKPSEQAQPAQLHVVCDPTNLTRNFLAEPLGSMPTSGLQRVSAILLNSSDRQLATSTLPAATLREATMSPRTCDPQYFPMPRVLSQLLL